MKGQRNQPPTILKDYDICTASARQSIKALVGTGMRERERERKQIACIRCLKESITK